MNTSWIWSRPPNSKVSFRYLIANGQARSFNQFDEEGYTARDGSLTLPPVEGSEFFKPPGLNYHVRATLLKLREPIPLPLELDIPAGDVRVKIGSFFGKPSAVVMATLKWQPREQQPELWLQAYLAPDSAWIERLINIDWINSPFRSGGSVGFTALWRDQTLQPGERLEIPLGMKQGLSRQIAPDGDESTPALVDRSNALGLDHGNARSVVEAYVESALAGDVAKAASLAKNSSADPKQIKELPEFLNVQRLKIETVYVNDPAKPTRALATSVAVKLDEEHKNPDGQRDGFMVFTLELTDDKWFVIDIDFESEAGSEKELKRFLEANPNSVGLPPLTPTSMPNLNPAKDTSDDHDRIQGAWKSLDSETLPVMPGGRNQFSVSFLADRMSMSGPQRAGIGTFSLSPDTVPKQIDCRLATGDKNIELKGIYEFRDIQLWLCLTEGEQRPKSFDNPPTVTGLMTFALERKQVELPDVDSSASLAMSDWSQSQVGAGVFATYTLSIPGIETISQGLAAGGPAVKEFSGVPGFPGKVFTLRYFLPNLSPRGMAFVAGTSFQSSLDLIELAQVAEHKRLVKVFSYPDSEPVIR